MIRDARSRWIISLLLLFTSLQSSSARPTAQGCYSSAAPLVLQGTSDSQDVASCNDACIATSDNRLVLGLSDGTNCFCGSELPSLDDQAGVRFCDTPCSGDDDYLCGGGTQYISVWLTEVGTDADNVPTFDGTTSSSSSVASSTTSTTDSPTSTANDATTTGGGNNGGNNDQPTSSSGGAAEATGGAGAANSGDEKADKSSSDGHNDSVVAIAVGVVIGVVALALVGFIFWWVWRRRRQTGTYSRYSDSVDGSSTALQTKSSKRAFSPETTGPEMAMAGNTATHNPPPITVQRPTPGPGSPINSVYSMNAYAGPAAVARAAGVATAATSAALARHSQNNPPVNGSANRVSPTTGPSPYASPAATAGHNPYTAYSPPVNNGVNRATPTTGPSPYAAPAAQERYTPYSPAVDSGVNRAIPTTNPPAYAGPAAVAGAAGVATAATPAALERHNQYNPSANSGVNRAAPPTNPPAYAGPAAVAASEGVATVAAPAALARHGQLNPPVDSRVSRASSNTDPFYVPQDHPPMPAQGQTTMDDTSSDSDFEENSDTLSPLEDIRGPQRYNSRTVPYAYSSEQDFADGMYADGTDAHETAMPGQTPGFFNDWSRRFEVP